MILYLICPIKKTRKIICLKNCELQKRNEETWEYRQLMENVSEIKPEGNGVHIWVSTKNLAIEINVTHGKTLQPSNWESVSPKGVFNKNSYKHFWLIRSCVTSLTIYNFRHKSDNMKEPLEVFLHRTNYFLVRNFRFILQQQIRNRDQ